MNLLLKQTLCAAALTLPALAGAQDKPNILLILTDQQNVDMITALKGQNSSFVSTPNLDRLVDRGYSFTNTYCANPLSVPSRFALMTGQYGYPFGVRNNNPLPEKEKETVAYLKKNAMGNVFRQAGYDTYYGGKIHLPYASGNKLSGSTERYGFELIEESSREELAVTGAKFFENRKGDKPFLLYLSFINPHDICEESWLKLLPDEAYKKAMGPLPLATLLPYQQTMTKLGDAQFEADGISNLMPNPGPMKGHKLIEARWEETKHITDVEWRKYRWIYYRLVEHVDSLIGQVLDALEQSPYNDNTIVIFTSDHGEMGGSHGLRGKNLFMEECMKVPFVIAGKGVVNDINAKTLVCNGRDLLPTMCDMASIAAPSGLPGVSMWPVATGSKKKIDRDHIFMECASSFCVIDTQGNKYTKYDQVYANGMEVFVNLKKEPLELRNMIKSEKYAPRIAELRAICTDQLDANGFVEPEKKFRKPPRKNQGEKPASAKKKRP